jgi:hypothetical protein
LLATTLLLATVAALLTALLTAVTTTAAAAGRVATLRRSPGCATALAAAVAFWRMLV